MSIRDEIERRVRDGALVAFEPNPPISWIRPVFLVPWINQQVTGPWKDRSDEAREMPEVRADLEHFVGGGNVPAAFGKRPSSVMLRRLSAPKRRAAGVWEIRTQTPRPGQRLFGFFAAPDVFVGVELLARDGIDFNAVAQESWAKWHQLFPGDKPVISENIHDYITENVVRLR